MAKNKTGTDVYVHHEGKTSKVGPDEDFPEGYEPDGSLTESDDEDDGDEEVPGPGQFRVSRSPVEQNKDWADWKVPELRAALGDGNYEQGDRKDALVSKAITAGVDPKRGKG